MKSNFNHVHRATPPRDEACRRTLRAVMRHLNQIGQAQDREEIVDRLAKINLIERNLSHKPGDYALGQEDELTALMRAALAVQEFHTIGNDELFSRMAALRNDWEPEDRLFRYAATPPALR